MAQSYSEGERVRVVEHADHSLPAVFDGCVGWRGHIVTAKEGDLYDVALDDADPVPTVQLHAEQLASLAGVTQADLDRGEELAREHGWD